MKSSLTHKLFLASLLVLFNLVTYGLSATDEENALPKVTKYPVEYDIFDEKRSAGFVPVRSRKSYGSWREGQGIDEMQLEPDDMKRAGMPARFMMRGKKEYDPLSLAYYYAANGGAKRSAFIPWGGKKVIDEQFFRKGGYSNVRKR